MLSDAVLATQSDILTAHLKIQLRKIHAAFINTAP